MVIPEWIQWAQVVVAGSIPFLLLFGRSYLQKKAENLATKQDIAEITRTTDGIKGQLNWAVQNRLSLDEEQPKAVLVFYKKYHYWPSSCEDPTCGIGDDDRLTAIEQSLQRRMAAFIEMDETYAMFTIFSVDAAMADQGWERIKKTIELQRLGDNHLYAMMPIAFKVAQQLIAPITEEKAQEYSALLDKLDAMNKALAEATWPLVNEVGVLNVSLISQTRQVLCGQVVVQ